MDALVALLALTAFQELAAEPPRRMPAHKMYYVAAANQRSRKLVNERAVDSYFRLMRATPPATAPARSPPPPLTQPAQDQYWQSKRTTAAANQVTQVKDEELLKPSRNEYFGRHSVYEKRTVVSKGNRKSNRRPHRAQHFHQKTYLSRLRDDADAPRTLFDSAPYHAKEYTKRNTGDTGSVSQRTEERNDGRPSPAGVARPADERAAAAVGRGPAGDGWDAAPGGRAAAPGGRGSVADGWDTAAGERGAALFYRGALEEHEAPVDARAALEEAADGAYYRGSASSYVDLNVGRKPAPAL